MHVSDHKKSYLISITISISQLYIRPNIRRMILSPFDINFNLPMLEKKKPLFEYKDTFFSLIIILPLPDLLVWDQSLPKFI